MADVQRTRQMCKHRPHPSRIGDPAGERIKFSFHTVILGGKAGGGGTGQPFAAPVSLVLRDDIVELAERAFLLDFLTEARG